MAGIGDIEPLGQARRHRQDRSARAVRTQKASSNRVKIDEMVFYTVHDGKIVREEFFYDMG